MNIPHASRYANQNGGYRKNKSSQRGRNTSNANARREYRPSRTVNTSSGSGFTFKHVLIGGIVLFVLLKIIF